MPDMDEVIVDFGKPILGSLLVDILSTGAQEMHLIPSVRQVNTVRRYAANDKTSETYDHTEFSLRTTGTRPVVTASYDEGETHTELQLNIRSSFRSREQYLLNVTSAIRYLKQ